MIRRLSRLREERGISTVIAVVSLIGLFGAVLLSVDAGNAWQTRRNIITGTDATALDQAIFAARTGATSCNDLAGTYNPLFNTWTEILTRNSTGANPISCTFHADPNVSGAGWVGVEGNKVSEARFGGLFGIGNAHPYSFSAAQIFFPEGIIGLRPIGLCILNDHYQEWLNSLPPPDGSNAALPTPGSPGHPTSRNGRSYGTGVVHHILFEKDQPDECGDLENSPGNWGWVDYDGSTSGNGSSTTADWVLNGYDGTVNAPDDCDADGVNPDPSGGAGDQCNGDPGTGGGGDNGGCNTSNVAGSLRCIMSTPTEIHEFPIIVFDSASGCGTAGGGGNNCRYDLARYVFVRLWGFDLGSNGFFDFEFVEGIATGICCDTTPEQTDVQAVRLCAVDHDSRSEASRCSSG